MDPQLQYPKSRNNLGTLLVIFIVAVLIAVIVEQCREPAPVVVDEPPQVVLTEVLTPEPEVVLEPTALVTPTIFVTEVGKPHATSTPYIFPTATPKPPSPTLPPTRTPSPEPTRPAELPRAGCDC